MTSCFCQLVPLSHVLGMQHEISKTTQPGPTGCNWLDVVKTSYLHCNCCRGCFFLWCCSCARPHCKDADHGSTLMNSLLRLLWTQGPSWSWNTEIRPLKFSASSLAKAWASLWNGSFVHAACRDHLQPALSVSCDPFIWFQQQCYIDQRQGASHQTTRL